MIVAVAVVVMVLAAGALVLSRRGNDNSETGHSITDEPGDEGVPGPSIDPQAKGIEARGSSALGRFLIGRPMLGPTDVFVLTEYGVSALDRDTGDVRWSTEVCHGPDWADPRRHLALDVLVVSCDDGIRGVSAADGRQVWALDGERHPPYLRTGSRSVVIGRGRRVEVVDLATGVLRWVRDLALDNHPVAVADGRVFVTEGQSLRGYDETTGKLLWDRPVNVGWLHVEGGSVFVRTFAYAFVELDPATGATRWQTTGRDERLRQTVIVGVTGGHLVLGGDNRLHGWRVGTGQFVWEFDNAYAAFAGEGLVATTGPDALIVRDAATGRVVSRDTSSAGAFAPSLDSRSLAFVVNGTLFVRPLPR